MSCFWSGIIQGLKNNTLIEDVSITNLIKYLKENNNNVNIICNGEQVSDKQCEEIKEHIKSLSDLNINNGYDCSTFDPVLLLICELFQISIIHKYNGVIIKYDHPKPIKQITYQSSSNHFWY